MQGFLIERYWPSVTVDDVVELNDRLDESSSAEATFVGSLLVTDDEVVLIEFLAVDAAAALAVSRRARLRCDRIVAVTRLVGARGPHPGTQLGP